MKALLISFSIILIGPMAQAAKPTSKDTPRAGAKVNAKTNPPETHGKTTPLDHLIEKGVELNHIEKRSYSYFIIKKSSNGKTSYYSFNTPHPVAELPSPKVIIESSTGKTYHPFDTPHPKTKPKPYKINYKNVEKARIAIQAGNIEKIQKLLGNFNTSKDAFHALMRYAPEDMLQTLNNRAYDHSTLLEMAHHEGNPEWIDRLTKITREMIEEGKTYEIRELLDREQYGLPERQVTFPIVMKYASEAFLQELFNDKKGAEALVHTASQINKPQWIERLTKPILQKIAKGSVEELSDLLMAETNVSSKKQFVQPLVMEHASDETRKALSKRPRLDLMHEMIKKDFPELAEQLKASGVNLNPKQFSDKPPLDRAMKSRGHLDSFADGCFRLFKPKM